MAQFFESLGAPLKNVRWSWGARRPKDGVIFLRAWKDEYGYRERQAHIRQIESGARCVIVMCEAQDASASPRALKTFDTRTLIEGRDIEIASGKTWIRVIGHKRVSEVQ
jgi:hypothetical protein